MGIFWPSNQITNVTVASVTTGVANSKHSHWAPSAPFPVAECLKAYYFHPDNTQYRNMIGIKKTCVYVTRSSETKIKAMKNKNEHIT